MVERRILRSIALYALANGGIPMLSSTAGGCLADAACVCLDDQKHFSGAPIAVSGDFEEMYELVWSASTDQMRRFWADDELATQWGAEGVAILLVLELTDLTVIERSCKGTGFDYWLGQATSDALLFQNKARLEVSGIRNGTDAALNQRVKQKIEQTRRSDGALPAYVIVVEFSRPRCRVIKRGVP